MLVTYWAAKGGLKASDIAAIGVGAGASVVAAIENKSVDGISQSDPAPLTILQEKKLIKILVDTRTMKGNQELFGGSMPAACLYAQPALLGKTPNTAQALATAIVRANEWLQTASPADVAAAVPPGYLLGDKAIYERAFRQRARDDLAGRRDAGRRSGQLPEVPGRWRSQDRAGEDQTGRDLDQRIRRTRQEAQLADRADSRGAGAGAGRHYLPLCRARWPRRSLHSRRQRDPHRGTRRVRVGGRPDWVESPPC